MQPVLIAGRYEIRQALGSGGAGTVYQAWDTQLQRFVAVKRWAAPEPMLDDRAGTERLWREAMTLAAIQHPNILTIHDFGVDEEGPYVITEFVDGETLDRVIQRGPMDVDAFAEAAQQILEALIAAHQTGLIHRDIKPQNVMRTRLASGAWQYKILDFGLARFVTQPTVQSLEGNKSIYGSILYIAPEQLRHQPLDARTDIYATGCLFYYMLSGRNAVEGDTIAELITSHLEHRVRPLAELRPELPPELCTWVEKAMAYDPQDRFPSAAVALAALGKALPGKVRTAPIRIGPASATAATARIPVGEGAPRPIPRRTMTVPIAVAAAPRVAVWLWAPPTAAAILLAIVAGVIFLRHKPAGAPADRPEAAAESAWSGEPTIIESVITTWPPYIPPERRPLIQKYFEQLRENRQFKWGSLGIVFDAVALLQLNETLNTNEFKTLNHLTYHDATGKTLGELDVIIWHLREERAEVVFESAVSDQLRRKAAASRNQLQRFSTALQKNEVVKILNPYDPNWNASPEQFRQARFEILGNQGAIKAGFDMEVDITSKETEFLQRRLRDWRKARDTSL